METGRIERFRWVKRNGVSFSPHWVVFRVIQWDKKVSRITPLDDLNRLLLLQRLEVMEVKLMTGELSAAAAALVDGHKRPFTCPASCHQQFANETMNTLFKLGIYIYSYMRVCMNTDTCILYISTPVTKRGEHEQTIYIYMDVASLKPNARLQVILLF